MHTKPIFGVSIVFPIALTLYTGEASAQQLPPPAAGPGAPVVAPVPVAPVEEGDKDGLRFRGGVSATAGGMLLSGYSGFLGGVEGRLGLQINNLIGAYAVPHLSFGPLKIGGLGTIIGLFSLTAVADVTLIDHIFVGAGAGYGIVNSPSGPVVHFRAGGYPLMGRGDNGIRRKGLKLGTDVRLYILPGATVMQLTGGIGYEAF